VKILIDMNLSPEWCGALEVPGWEVRHWSKLGPHDATDKQLLEWARENHHVLLTQEMDFPQLLFQTQAGSPSVVLLRLENELDTLQQDRVKRAIVQSSDLLEKGCLMVIDSAHVRVRSLPIQTD
jgi:predicted nuclease of predicted toxin-antitoxin system